MNTPRTEAAAEIITSISNQLKAAEDALRGIAYFLGSQARAYRR